LIEPCIAMVSAQPVMQGRMPLSPVSFARFSDQVQ